MKTLEKNWLEWVCFGVSALLVCAVVSYLTYNALTAGDAPPEIVFRLDPAQQRDGYFVIHVMAENHGDRTAAAVRVEVRLTNDAREERAEFEIDYLPRHGRREGFVTFHGNPKEAGTTVRARALGYTRP